MGKETGGAENRAEAEMEARIFNKLSAEVERFVNEKTKSRGGLGLGDGRKGGVIERHWNLIGFPVGFVGAMAMLVVMKYFLALESLP